MIYNSNMHKGFPVYVNVFLQLPPAESQERQRSKSMTNLKDVAKLADVSIATVSRVLNGTSRVSEEKKQAVMSAIKKLDYRPNLAASSLRAKESKIIGVILPGRTHATLGINASYIADVCSENGYSLLVGLHHDDPDTETAMIDSFCRRNIDGLLISSSSEESAILRLVANYDIPIVFLVRVLRSDKFSCASIDNYKAGYIAGKYLASLGHKLIGCLTQGLNVWQPYQRLAGFKTALHDHGVEFYDKYVVEVPALNYEYGVYGAQKLLAQKAGGLPTAIWAMEDQLAAGAMQTFISAGYRIPDDLSIMGMDNIDLSHMLSPALTTITYPFQEIANVVVRCILDRCAGGKATDTQQFVFDPQLVVRGSTTAPPLNPGINI